MEVRFLVGGFGPVTIALDDGSTVASAKSALRQSLPPGGDILLLHEGTILDDDIAISSLSLNERSYVYAKVAFPEAIDLQTCFHNLADDDVANYCTILTLDPTDFETVALQISDSNKALLARLLSEKHRLAEFLKVPINALYSVKPTDHEINLTVAPTEEEDHTFDAWPVNVISPDSRGHRAEQAGNFCLMNVTPLATKGTEAEAEKETESDIIDRFVADGYDPMIVHMAWRRNQKDEERTRAELEGFPRRTSPQ
jgi:hypothetical protein